MEFCLVFQLSVTYHSSCSLHDEALPQGVGPSAGEQPEAEWLARLAMTAASAVALQSTSHVAGICDPADSWVPQAHRSAL